MSFLNYNPTIFNIVHIHITLYFISYGMYILVYLFFLIHKPLSVYFSFLFIYIFFVIYVTVSPISNTC